jgi:hypothetical protein
VDVYATYINDRLSAEQDIGERRRYTQTLSRQSRFAFEPAQVMALLRKQISGQDRQRAHQEQRLIDRALRKKFDPEFINCIDAVLSFNHLQRAHLSNVLRIELAKFQERLGKRQTELKLNAECRSYLVEKYDPRYGARHIVRRLCRDLEPAVARAMLANPDYGEFIAALRNQGIIVEPIQQSTFLAIYLCSEKMRFSVSKPRAFDIVINF